MDARGASVSEAELEVLKVLWEHAAGTVREINTILWGQGRRWAYTTVQTLLQRLESKGYVHSDRSSPAHIYRAAVSREELLSRRLWELADQLCDGTASPLLLALVGDSRLSAEEIKQLRQLLDQLQSPKRPRPRSG
jgi:BlaI family transcriptional regulator, penicillinase repressor